MRLQVILVLLFFPILGTAQERGLGLRLGEPFSISYKDFVKNYFSYEILVGSGSINSPTYYRKSFDRRPPSPGATLVSLEGTRGVALSYRMAFHADFTDSFNLEEGYLLVYSGLGMQLRTAQVSYRYTKTNTTMNPQGPFEIETRTNGDVGPEAFLGAEYYFDPVPFSVFVEGGVFMELIDRMHVKGQGGIGIRYLF